MESKSKSKVPPSGKASWRIINVITGEITYTRDIQLVQNAKDINDIYRTDVNNDIMMYEIQFVSNTPPAVEVLYFSKIEDE